MPHGWPSRGRAGRGDRARVPRAEHRWRAGTLAVCRSRSRERWSRSSPIAPSGAARPTMPPVPAAGCGWRSSASRSFDDFVARHARDRPSRLGHSPSRAAGNGDAHGASLEQLAKTWAGEEYWFWARRVLRKLRHGIRRAGQSGAPPAGRGETPVVHPGAPAARRQHRHGRARHGQLRPRASCAWSPRATAGPTRRRALPPPAPTSSSTARRRSPRSRTRSPGSTGSAPPPRASATSPSPCSRPSRRWPRCGGGWRDGQRCGILFGPERNGLETEEVANADAVVMAPVNPNFASLNLAQAVLLVELRVDEAGRTAARSAG